MNSEGWIWTKPRSSQRWAPLLISPRTSTATSSETDEGVERVGDAVPETLVDHRHGDHQRDAQRQPEPCRQAQGSWLPPPAE